VWVFLSRFLLSPSLGYLPPSDLPSPSALYLVAVSDLSLLSAGTAFTETETNMVLNLAVVQGGCLFFSRAQTKFTVVGGSMSMLMSISTFWFWLAVRVERSVGTVCRSLCSLHSLVSPFGKNSGLGVERSFSDSLSYKCH
jgi:hypothetical protein